MHNTFSCFLDSALLPFNIAVIALILISLIETIGFYFGVRPLSFLRHFIPLGLHNPLLSIKFSKILILIFFLINFSFAGYFLQFFCYAYHGTFFPIIYISIPALLIAIFFTIFMIHCLDQVIKPKYLNKKTNLVGRLAIISQGTASPSTTAQARVRDEYGQLHYIQVRSESGEIAIDTQITLVHFEENEYIVKKIVESNHLFDYDIFPESKLDP